MKLGRPAKGLRWCTVANSKRIAVLAYYLWGGSDPILQVQRQQTLTAVFQIVEVHVAQKAGHFVNCGLPDLWAKYVIRFFANQIQEVSS